MSDTYQLVCHKTKQKIWVGQGWEHKGGMYGFYSGDPEIMARLGRFLNATRGNELVLMNTDVDDGDWHDYEKFEGVL